MPITLWRSMLVQMWRLLVLTSAVVVIVIAFAAAVKPMGEGKLSPGDALRFIVLAIPPMLAYALPFAGGFAATLAYHRTAQDNEVVGAQAGGISHRSLLVPALITGLALSAALLMLNELVIPRFLRSMQRLVTADVPRLLAGAVERGRSVEMNGVVVFADKAERFTPDPSTTVASDYLLLTRMAALELDGAGAVSRDVTASRADLWLMPADRAGDESAGKLVMRLEGVVVADPEEGLRPRFQGVDLVLPVMDAFQDDPKFLTFSELAALRDDPESMNWIELRRRDLAYHIASRRAVAAMAQALASEGRITLDDSDGRVAVVRGAALAAEGGRWKVVGAAGRQVEVELTRAAERANRPSNTPAGSGNPGTPVTPGSPGTPGSSALPGTGGVTEPAGSPGAAQVVTTILAAPVVFLELDLGEDRSRRKLEFSLRLIDARVQPTGPRSGATQAGAGASGAGPTGERMLGGLSARGLAPTDLLDRRAWPSARLVELARGTYPSDGEVMRVTEDLDRLIADLGREVTSKQHERLALAASCAVMVLTGAVTALLLSKRLPLTVYLFSFFPALASVITIGGGQQMTHALGAPGLALLWSGVGALGLYTFAVYMVIARH